MGFHHVSPTCFLNLPAFLSAMFGPEFTAPSARFGRCEAAAQRAADQGHHRRLRGAAERWTGGGVAMASRDGGCYPLVICHIAILVGDFG